MGIFNFFPWMKRVYPSCISTVSKNATMKKSVDDFMIDGNCIYHPAAQKIFKYGEYKKRTSLLHDTKTNVEVEVESLYKDVFNEICSKMDELIRIVKPRKRFIMCTDGSAPLAKQFQQRCRRYKSSMDGGGDGVFDPNSITPGTEFMYKMSKHIRSFLRDRKKKDDLYRNIEIIFNDERIPGEGEHKLINFIRSHPLRMKKNSFCIYSADADLIMLALSTHEENFYILRENIYDKHLQQHFCVSLKELRLDLISDLIPINERGSCGDLHKYKTINDFVLLCFFVGNDFLPHMPSIEIKDGGINQILKIYSKLNMKLTYYDHNGMVKIHIQNFILFCENLAKIEPRLVNDRYNSSTYRNSTPLKCLDNNVTLPEGSVDFIGFQRDYYQEKLNISTVSQVRSLCHEYIRGLQWVITYYTSGIPDWNWKFKEHYGPFVSDLAVHLRTYENTPFTLSTNSIPPFLQLLCVLPPSSKKLLPNELQPIYETRKELFQEKVTVDLEGKRREYEVIVLVEDPNVDELRKEYYKYIGNVNDKKNKRNRKGKIFVL